MLSGPLRISLLYLTCLVLFQCKMQDETQRGTLIILDAFPSEFVDPRPILVWLPPGYTPNRKYAVLYMHDGQMLFDSTITWTQQEWKVDETMTRLLQKKKVRETIVVGIHNAGRFRWSEYLPQVVLNQIPDSIQVHIIHHWMQGRVLSDGYLRFITSELKPYIDQHYSTYADVENTFIMGSSMGSIISLYAICMYPEVFSGAACLSTHWPLDVPGFAPLETDFDLPAVFMDYLSEHLPAPDQHRIYFDYGTASLDALYPPYQKHVDTLMKQRGYSVANWLTREFPGEDHSEQAWARRLHIPLEFLLRPE